MKRQSAGNALALAAGWFFTLWAWGHYVPQAAWFILGAMLGITGVTVESSVIDWLSVRRGRCLSSDEQAISPLLATVLLIAITIVLAVVLYFMVLYEVGGHP